MIIPLVGSTRLAKMTGRRIATPETGPMPGRTPIAVPTRQPTSANSRFVGVSASWKPRPSPATGSIYGQRNHGSGGSCTLRNDEKSAYEPTDPASPSAAGQGGRRGLKATRKNTIVALVGAGQRNRP